MQQQLRGTIFKFSSGRARMVAAGRGMSPGKQPSMDTCSCFSGPRTMVAHVAMTPSWMVKGMDGQEDGHEASVKQQQAVVG